MIASTIPNRVHQPLTFSIDDRLLEQHLTRLDLCSKSLKKIDKPQSNIPFNVVLLDHNDITKVEHLDILTHLIELSISHNRLIDIRLISRLRTLQKLNLSYNSLDSVDALKNLQNLVMLNISNNNIQNIGMLNTCQSLQSLDASDNAIHAIEDLSPLKTLKYLSLHRNLIGTLAAIPKNWPKSIHTLIISDNELNDLTEVYYLSSFIDLNTLYIHDNPCLFVIDEHQGWHQPFDYRPYILNWCLAIHNLDGTFITRKESLKSEWLLSQGKGRSYRPGEHNELVQYLIKVCGTDADERDDLHLSRVMLQQDLYKQNTEGENFSKATDTMKDASETLSKDTQTKLRQSLLLSESEFVQFSPASSVSTVNEPMLSERHRVSYPNSEPQTPSPRYAAQPINYNGDQISEHSSNNRYSDYDNRPIKPLDKNMLQSKLNQYPIENHTNNDTNGTRPQTATVSQQSKRVPAQVVYSANRYSPKTTNTAPTASTATHVNMRVRSNNTTTTQAQNGDKRYTIATDDANTFDFSSHSDRTTIKTSQKLKHKQQNISNGHKTQPEDEDDDECQLKSTREHGTFSTQRTTSNQDSSIDIQRLSASIETMRTSVLQAYLDLHERFTATTELQTSAMASLWKMFDSQNQTHQQETEKILEENRLLSQRIQDLEKRFNVNTRILHPPLRAYISKRDKKSFFLHWISNPLNEQNKVLGYRIYIGDVLKNTVDADKFEAVIDCIQEEGNHRIKLRTYDQYGESEDSNVIIARFRRQQTEIAQPTTSETRVLHRSRSEDIVHSVNQAQVMQNALRQMQSEDHVEQLSADEMSAPTTTDKQPQQMNNGQSTPSSRSPLVAQHNAQILTTPEKNIKNSSEPLSPTTTSPSYSNQANSANDHISRKPPRSPSSSPRRHDRVTTDNETCNGNVSSNNTNDSGSATARKRSPTRTGFMSRLAKSPHRIKNNNVLLNALPVQPTPSSTEPLNTHPSQTRSIEQFSTFHREINVDNNHQDFLFQQLSQRGNLVNCTSSSPSFPLSARNQNILVNSFDQNSC